MRNQSIDALAIRYPEVQKVIPVTVFVDQDLSAANLPRKSSWFGKKNSSLKNEISEICFVVDTSRSMNKRLDANSTDSKLEHIKNKLSGFLGSFDCDSAKLSLVTFCREAKAKTSLTKKTLGDELAKLETDKGTNFEKAFSEVDRVLSPDPSKRKLVVFITDGEDMGSRRDAHFLAREIKAKNAGVVVVGVGADYEARNVYSLSGSFGYSGSGHTPMHDPEENAFDSYLQVFAENMRASDSYISVESLGASWSDVSAFAATPSIREFTRGRVDFGYQQSSVGVFFFRKEENIDLLLRAGRFYSDTKEMTKSIEVVDSAMAAAHFERVQLGEEVIKQVLLMKAKLDGGRDMLEELSRTHPSLRRDIDFYIRQTMEGASFDENARLEAKRSLSETANSIFTQTLRDEDVRKLGLHSGDIGPLEMSFDKEVPPMTRPDAMRYEKLIPKGHAKLKFAIEGEVKEFDLETLKVGDYLRIGRGPDCHIQIAKSEVSTNHCLIFRTSEKEFKLRDLASRNKTRVNGRDFKGDYTLTKGDKINVYTSQILFF